jgi:ribosomal protein L11 methyltransferase
MRVREGGFRLDGQRSFVRYRIEAPPEEWDRLVGELHEAGTTGVEERPDGSPALVAWFGEGVDHAAIRRLDDPALGVHVREPERVAGEDWGRRWREGLEPRRIGPLRIRPSWSEPGGGPELVLDPGRAFGSGEHATTRLALGLLLDAVRPGDAVLDVGTGSGILALGALRVGAARAVGVDPDPAACAAARENARRNRLDLPLVCGTLDAIASDARFEQVVANLLLVRVEPWLGRLARHASRGLILSGYLEAQREHVVERLAALGMAVVREEGEEQTGERWLACRCTHASLQ